MKVVLSPTARRKLDALLEYLQEEWSVKSKHEFIKKLDKRIDQITTHPKSCPESQEIKRFIQMCGYRPNQFILPDQ